MRVLIGYDASVGGDLAVALAGSITWPTGSSLRVVSAIEPSALPMAGPWARGGDTMSPDITAEVRAYLQERVDAVVETLTTPDRTVDGAVVRGRPASVLIDTADAFDADLIVVGSRGHGRVAALILGSVSSEVVDHAARPVLVARQAEAREVVFATDGSAAAAHVGSILATWSIFDGVPIRVVSVADVDQPWHTGVAPTMYRQVVDAYAKDLHESVAEHRSIAEEAAERLRAAGRDATAEVRTGDAAGEVIAAARDRGANLIAMGSRGRTGLTRVLLGSVARNVVHGSEASVLIVRE